MRRARPDPDPTGASSPATTSSATTDRPLQGSGLNPLDVLGTTDRITSRHATGGVALEVGLEQARQALLRSRPGDSLKALDAIWDGAQQTEEGWYLRSGALSALGLPGESERVAGDGLRVRPTSGALGFLQSLARMTIGDFAGARASLQVAIAQSPFEPVLQVQYALLQAKAGDSRSAESALQRLRATAPDHPALLWGRAALAALLADDARRRSRGVEADGWDNTRGDSVGRPPVDTEASALASVLPDIEAPDVGMPLPAGATDLASASLERLGASLAQRPVPMSKIALDARGLLRALSTGGALANAMSAEQAHAARVVLVTIAAHACGENADASSPVSRVVERIVPLLGQGRFEEARLAVQRQRSHAREPVSRLLLAIIRGAASASGAADGMGPRAAESVGQGVLPGIVQGEIERGPLSAIRLGLCLLEESPASRAGDASLRLAPAREERANDRVVLSEQSARDERVAERFPRGDGEPSGEGWGAAQQAAAQRSESRDAVGASMPLVAISAVLLAVAALATGHGLVATMLAVGAMWLGLRGPRASLAEVGEQLHDDHAARAAREGSVATHTAPR